MNKLLIGVVALLLLSGAARAEEIWQTLPKPPAMPTPVDSGMAPVNDIQMYYAVYGEGEPVLLIHGGLGNADVWGFQVPALAESHKVIVADSRGHGRSTRSDEAVRLRADGGRLPRPARSPGDRQGGAGRLERRRHHRARHRDPPSRAPEPAVRVRRQLHARGSQGERRERSDLQCLHRAGRQGVCAPVADA